MKKFLVVFTLFSILLLGATDDNDVELIDVRSDDNFPPYEFIEDGIPVGFNIDIMHAATEAVGIYVHHSSDKWEVILQDLKVGNIDMLTGMFQSEAREPIVDFSAPVLILSHSIFVREGSDIKNIEDAKGKNIIVQNLDITHDYLLENNITDNIITVNNKEEALLLLESGQYDCALLSRVNAFYLMDKHDINNIVEVGEEVFKLNFCFAVTEGDIELITALNEGLAIIKSNGTYDLLYNKWFALYENRNINAKVLEVILWITIPTVIVIALILLWSYSLKKQVNSKTKEIININDHLEEMVFDRTRQLEETHIKLLETQKNSMFSELVLGVSHEMNTPLGNIMTLITYEMSLKNKLKETLNADQLKRDDLNIYLEKTNHAEVEIRKSLDEIIKMIDIFKSLDIKKLNKITTFNMFDLIKTSVKYVLSDNSEKHIDFNIDCNSNTIITGYSDALFQVLHGLVENSIVHGFSDRDKGSIDISFRSENMQNELIIHDNGKGMTENTKDHVFDYFFSEDKRFGTGLGLNRTHNIIHFLLDGSIYIESELGVGTTVTIKW